MEIIGWHGGWGDFTFIDEKYIGTGENNAQGWGFYLAENRVGGEYFAKYLHFKRGTGFLYKVKLHISKDEYWENADHTGRLLENGKNLDYLYYRTIREEQGNQKAAAYLKNNGIKVFSLWETDKPKHGLTYIVLEMSCAQILEKYEYIYDPKQSYWNKIF